MLIFFFFIVFIAEVKLVIDLIIVIRMYDKKVCIANNLLSQNSAKIPQIITEARLFINSALIGITKAKLKIAEKKEEYRYKLIKNVITTALFFTLNVNGKKAITVVELTFTLRDFIKTAIKAFHSLKK